MTVAQGLWPADGQGKVLLCLKLNCKADELFKEMCVNPDISAQLHKLRNDTNLVETSWYSSQDELPQPRFTWDPATAKPSKLVVGAGTWRKVKFDSPPAAMVKQPFQNEELHCCVEHKPGMRYVMEIQANTNAYMGDKFDVMFKMTISTAPDKASSLLHVQYCINWSKSANFMVKSTLAVPVDGGVRGSYKVLRQVLEGKFKCEDVPEAQLTAQLAEASTATTPSTTAAAAAAPAPAALPAAVHHVVPAAVTNPLEFFMSQLVWNEQVSAVSGVVGVGMRSAANEGVVARVMAAIVTLSLIHAVVSILHAVQAVCAGRRYVLWVLCLPITHVIDLPDSLTEVLTSVLLVAAVNYGILWSAQASLAHLKAHNTHGSEALSTSDATALPSATTATTTATAADLKGAADSSKSNTTTGAAAADSTAQAKPMLSAPPARPIPQLQHVSKAGPKRADIIAPKGKAAPVMSSSPSLTAATAPGTAAVATPAPTTTTTTPGPAFVHSQSTTALSTSVDGSGNSIAAAASAAAAIPRASSVTSVAAANGKQSEVEIPIIVPVKISGNGSAVKGSNSGVAGVGGPEGTPVPASPDASKSPAHATGPSGKPPIAVPGKERSSRASSPAPTPAPAAAGGGGAKTPKASDTTTTTTVTAAGITVADAAPAGAEDLPVSLPDAAAELSTTHSEALSGNGGVSATAAVLVPPTSPPPPARSPTTPRGAGIAAGTALGLANSPGAPGTPTVTSPNAASAAAAAAGVAGAGVGPAGGSGHVYGAQYPPAGSPSNLPGDLTKTWYKTMSDGMDALAEGFKGAFGMRGGDEPGGGGTAEGGVAGRPGLLTTWESGPAATGGDAGGGGALGGYHEGPLQAEEEVFENERFQPFRGWGHTWPGHFLPSDRVGHWSDAQGGPGGSASMIFEQVEPVLPPGYTWVEDEWQLDMEALEREGVDENGWTYALDFNYLRHPPPAGSGKCTLKHFVRRRRWFRTRIRLSSTALPAPPAQHMSKDDSSLPTSGSLSLGSSPTGVFLTPPSPARTSPVADRQLSNPMKAGVGGEAAGAGGKASSTISGGGGGGGGGGSGRAVGRASAPSPVTVAGNGAGGTEDGHKQGASKVQGGEGKVGETAVAAGGGGGKTGGLGKAVSQVKTGKEGVAGDRRSVELQSPRVLKDEQELVTLPKQASSASGPLQGVSSESAGKRTGASGGVTAAKTSAPAAAGGGGEAGTAGAGAASKAAGSGVLAAAAGRSSAQAAPPEATRVPSVEAAGAIDMSNKHTRSARQAALGKALEAMLKPSDGSGSVGGELGADGAASRSPRAVDAAGKPSAAKDNTIQHPLQK